MAVLIALQYINCKYVNFITPDFIYYPIIACGVFLFFNFLKRAKCFAGDVGSMAISFWIITLLLQLMLKTNSIIWIMFLAVYGTDSILTIFHRIYLKHNIFKAHRLHLYQILTNEKQLSHLKVSTAYAMLQLIICAAIIYAHLCNPSCELPATLIIILFLILVYTLKFRLKKYS
jgi:UDP-N-acetylmuramyl pentapeptide phosphotransferase/UDP-N-acetylglucosamine-1-phosphate transferase